jgi:hypothetical protein
MVELEEFMLVPRLRCFEQVAIRDGGICGRPARWMRIDRAVLRPTYFCDTHRKAADEVIPADAPFRRVRLTVEVLMAGASWTPAIAHAEAVERLERVVRAGGGWLDVKMVTSTSGRASPQAVRRRPEPSGGGR